MHFCRVTSSRIVEVQVNSLSVAIASPPPVCLLFCFVFTVLTAACFAKIERVCEAVNINERDVFPKIVGASG